MSVGPLIFVGIMAVLGLAYWLDQRTTDDRSKKPSRLRSFTSYPSAVRTAAYRFISPTLIWPSYLGGTIDQIVKAEAHFERKREEAMNLNNPELRDCVLAYIDYHANTWLPKKAQELRNQTTKRELEAYRARKKNNDAEVTALLKAEGLTDASLPR